MAFPGHSHAGPYVQDGLDEAVCSCLVLLDHLGAGGGPDIGTAQVLGGVRSRGIGEDGVDERGQRVVSLERQETLHGAGSRWRGLARGRVLATSSRDGNDGLDGIQGLAKGREGSQVLLRQACNAGSQEVRIGADFGNEVEQRVQDLGGHMVQKGGGGEGRPVGLEGALGLCELEVGLEEGVLAGGVAGVADVVEGIVEGGEALLVVGAEVVDEGAVGQLPQWTRRAERALETSQRCRRMREWALRCSW